MLNQHKSIHPHLEITLRIEQRLKNDENVLQKTTNFRWTVANNSIEFKAIFACFGPMHILFTFYYALKDGADLSCMQLLNAGKSTLGR